MQLIIFCSVLATASGENDYYDSYVFILFLGIICYMDGRNAFTSTKDKRMPVMPMLIFPPTRSPMYCWMKSTPNSVVELIDGHPEAIDIEASQEKHVFTFLLFVFVVNVSFFINLVYKERYKILRACCCESYKSQDEKAEDFQHILTMWKEEPPVCMRVLSKCSTMLLLLLFCVLWTTIETFVSFQWQTVFMQYFFKTKLPVKPIFQSWFGEPENFNFLLFEFTCSGVHFS